MKKWISIVSIVILAACTSTTQVSTDDTIGDSDGSEKTLEDIRKEAFEEIDQEACVADGGVVRAEGLLGLPMCVVPYADAGETCRSGSDCEGDCRGRDGVTDYDAPAGTQRGVCQANNSPFGCFATIEDGIATNFLCVD